MLCWLDVVIFTGKYLQKKNNVNFMIAPSTAMQLDLNLNDTAPGDFVLETPGYLMHRIDISNKLWSADY